MNTYLISYDLGSPETRTDYNALSKHIKSLYTKWARPVDSVWIIKSDNSAGDIRKQIKSELDENDSLIVVKLSGSWGTYNISKEVTDWLKKNM